MALISENRTVFFFFYHPVTDVMIVGLEINRICNSSDVVTR